MRITGNKPIAQLEKKYGIYIHDDSFFSPLTDQYLKRYKIYTADGCPWENGLSYRGLFAECKRYAQAFLDIKTACGKEF